MNTSGFYFRSNNRQSATVSGVDDVSRGFAQPCRRLSIYRRACGVVALEQVARD
jgi:hypothetical protein